MIATPLHRLLLLAVVVLLPVPAAQAQVSPVGRLESGGSFRGRISPAFDEDTFAFSAGIGEGIQLRVADYDLSELEPRISVYRPDGTLLTSAWSNTVAALSFIAPVTGIYTLVVKDDATGGANETGAYIVHYTRAPGANENGALVNGGAVSADLSIGDLDSFTFDANQGEGVQLRTVDTLGTSLAPRVYVYRPDGSLFTSTWSHGTAALSFAAPATGVYTLVVADDATGGYADTGAYEIHYTRVPGANEHGLLVNAGSVNETIDAGDLDSFTFVASSGEGILLRTADTGGTALAPRISVYRPDGSLYTSTWSNGVAALGFAAPATGVFTLVVADDATGGYGDVGDYEVHFARIPGANENGSLVNAGSVTGTIDVGDIDTFTFDAVQGEGIQLRTTNANGTSFAPRISVYRPDGVLHTSTWSHGVAAVNFAAPMTGTYTLAVVDDGTGGYGDAGDYEVHFVRAPGANEHGALPSGGSVAEAVDYGDLDSFTFSALVGDSIQLTMTDTGATSLAPRLHVYRPDGSLFTSTWSHSTAVLNFAAPATGVYTVVASDDGTGGFGDTGAYLLEFLQL